MVDRIPQKAKDVLARINAVVDALNQANNMVNPRFQSFGGAWAIPDARGAGARPPNAYPNAGAVIEFNAGSYLDYPPTGNANGYGYVMTIVGYTNDGLAGGGLPVQLGFGSQMSVRVATSGTTWSPWKKLASYSDVSAQFGLSTVGQTVIISGDVGTTGAALLLQTGSNSIVALGNKSALMGGAFDNTPYIFSPTPVSTYCGFNFGGMVSAQGQAELLKLANDAACISFMRTTNDQRTGFIQGSAGGHLTVMAEAGQYLRFGSGGGIHTILDVSGNIYPSNDAVKYCGVASARWAAIYASTGAIQTSDARKKTAVTKLTANARAAARQMLSEIGTYQWLESINEKGEDAARFHIGFTVQRAIAILEDHGIDPFKMAFICHDVWEGRVEKVQTNVGARKMETRVLSRQKVNIYTKVESVIEITDGKAILVEKEVEVREPVFEEYPVFASDGRRVMQDEKTPYIHRVPVMEDYEIEVEVDAEPEYEDVVHPAGDCYAFRYDQLALFMLSALAE